MSIGLQIYVDMEEPRRILDQMREFSGNPIHANRETGGYLVSRQIIHFDEGVDSQDVLWRPLSKYTRARRAAKGQGIKPLIATGSMRQSFSMVVSRDQVDVGTPAPQAPAQHFGTAGLSAIHTRLMAHAKAAAVGDTIGTYTSWNVPARPFLYADENEQQVIVSIYQDHLLKAMEADRLWGGQY